VIGKLCSRDLAFVAKLGRYKWMTLSMSTPLTIANCEIMFLLF
jgi:hypothetical protein